VAINGYEKPSIV